MLSTNVQAALEPWTLCALSVSHWTLRCGGFGWDSPRSVQADSAANVHQLDWSIDFDLKFELRFLTPLSPSAGAERQRCDCLIPREEASWQPTGAHRGPQGKLCQDQSHSPGPRLLVGLFLSPLTLEEERPCCRCTWRVNVDGPKVSAGALHFTALVSILFSIWGDTYNTNCWCLANTHVPASFLEGPDVVWAHPPLCSFKASMRMTPSPLEGPGRSAQAPVHCWHAMQSRPVRPEGDSLGLLGGLCRRKWVGLLCEAWKRQGISQLHESSLRTKSAQGQSRSKARHS